jgi:hypothetical protein
MKKHIVTYLTVALFAILSADFVAAKGGHHHGGGGHHRHSSVSLGINLGGGYYNSGYYGRGHGYYGYPYRYYNRPYYYYGRPYYYPPTVVVPSAPPVYIQQESATPAEAQINYWYYCRKPDGYYPYVKECPDGWLQVAPEPLIK